MKYDVLKNIPNHSKLQGSIKIDLFPEFMYHDPIANEHWMKLFDWFPEYQATLQSDEGVLGIANSIPCYWDRPFEELPEAGWDWAIEQGVADYQNGVKPNILIGLQISVNPDIQSKGISPLILQEMITLAKENGLPHIAIPVRPNLKCSYPLTPMENYIQWKREDGLPFDPWLRVHVRNGAQVIKACHRAVYVPGRVSEWEEWTGMKFPESGTYVVEGALSPITIDMEKDLGEYMEPNVWVVYRV